MNKERLIKLLNLTSSSNDSEALSSIRKANILIKEDNSNWEEIINISRSLESFIKRQDQEYAVLNMILLKERAYSQELKTNIHVLKNIIKYLLLLSIILISIIILK